jgi:cell surface protein SprA
MRSLSTTDFEAANIEYVEFWLMDPFVEHAADNRGGDFYINLGNVSEDILKDGRKSFENGLPTSEEVAMTSIPLPGEGCQPSSRS